MHPNKGTTRLVIAIAFSHDTTLSSKPPLSCSVPSEASPLMAVDSTMPVDISLTFQTLWDPQVGRFVISIIHVAQNYFT